LAAQLRQARVAETQAVTLADEVSALLAWLRPDILAVPGPDHANRRFVRSEQAERSEAATVVGVIGLYALLTELKHSRRRQPIGSDRVGETAHCYLKWSDFEPCPKLGASRSRNQWMSKCFRQRRPLCHRGGAALLQLLGKWHFGEARLFPSSPSCRFQDFCHKAWRRKWQTGKVPSSRPQPALSTATVNPARCAASRPRCDSARGTIHPKAGWITNPSYRSADNAKTFGKIICIGAG
jgi:hypothetical protein